MVVNYTSTPRPSVDAVDRFRGLTVQPNQRHRCEPWNLRPNSFACPDPLRSASRSMAGRCAGGVAGIKPGSFSLSWCFAREEPSDERICPCAWNMHVHSVGYGAATRFWNRCGPVLVQNYNHGNVRGSIEDAMN